MIIYEVNLEIDPDIYTSYRTWLQQHTQEMLTFQGFQKLEIFERNANEENGSDNGRHLLTLHYHVTSREMLQNYLDHHAHSMRKDGERLFGSKYRASRRILYPQ